MFSVGYYVASSSNVVLICAARLVTNQESVKMRVNIVSKSVERQKRPVDILASSHVTPLRLVRRINLALSKL